MICCRFNDKSPMGMQSQSQSGRAQLTSSGLKVKKKLVLCSATKPAHRGAIALQQLLLHATAGLCNCHQLLMLLSYVLLWDGVLGSTSWVALLQGKAA